MSLDLIVKQNMKSKHKKISVEMDVDKLERLAASFGFLNPDFLTSVNRAEKDYHAGRYRRIKSLRDVR